MHLGKISGAPSGRAANMPRKRTTDRNRARLSNHVDVTSCCAQPASAAGRAEILHSAVRHNASTAPHDAAMAAFRCMISAYSCGVRTTCEECESAFSGWRWKDELVFFGRVQQRLEFARTGRAIHLMTDLKFQQHVALLSSRLFTWRTDPRRRPRGRVSRVTRGRTVGRSTHLPH